MWVEKEGEQSDKAKSILKKKNLPCNCIEIDTIAYEDQLGVRDANTEVTFGYRAFPSIFIGTHHVGGVQDLEHLSNSGMLDEIAKQQEIKKEMEEEQQHDQKESKEQEAKRDQTK